jgi:hypothetical protein
MILANCKTKTNTHIHSHLKIRLNKSMDNTTARIMNLTPHAINIHGGITIPPSGIVARISVTQVPAGNCGGVPLFHQMFGEVENLPHHTDGVLLVVSALVRAACPDRFDLVSPGDPVRDTEGRVIGCKGLVLNY